MQRIGTGERRSRLVERHRLAPGVRATDPVEVARALVALHSSDAATVFLSTWARTPGFEAGRLEHALYEERALVRMLGMRRTLWVVPRELVATVHAACTRVIAARERRRLERFVAETGVPDPRRFVDEASATALRSLDERGQAFTTDLTRADPLLATKLRLGVGTRWETEASTASRVLPLLAAQGSIVRGRPRGDWTDGQYRWVPARAWLDGPADGADADAARAELLRRWLFAFGPATERDLRWWTGWTAREAREALAAVPHAVVELAGGTTGLVLANDVEPVGASEPAAALLPALDPTTMGWKERDWYLGPHAELLVDRSGNAGPTVWWDGRVVGGWSQRRDGELAFRLLEDVGAEGLRAVEAEAARLQEWLGDVRITPLFLPPFQRALSA